MTTERKVFGTDKKTPEVAEAVGRIRQFRATPTAVARDIRSYVAAQDQGLIQVSQSIVGDMRLAPAVPHEEAPDLGLDFSTPESSCDGYRAILLERKSVPIIDWDDRSGLVTHLWSVLADEPDGLSISEMNTELINFVRWGKMSVPDRAVQKLQHTLNIAKCFTDGHRPDYFQDLFSTRLRPAMTLDAALLAMHDVYIRGIHMEERSADLRPDGLSLLFYGDQSEAHIEEMRCLVETVTGRPASGHTAMAEAFAKAHPEA